MDSLEQRRLLAVFAATNAGELTTALAAAASAPGEDIVELSAGTYAGTFVVDSPVQIKRAASAAAGSVVVQGAGIGFDVTSTAGGNVSIDGIAFSGGDVGVRVPDTAAFGTLSITNSTFTGIQTNAISIVGNATTGLSASSLVLSGLTFTNNGFAGTGGTGDVSVFTYNGNATLSDLTLSNSGNGARLGIQFRGVGLGTGVGLLPSGTVSLSNIDISGAYRTQFIGIQRYSVANFSFSNVALGGSTSSITGTFGALLRFDAVGTGSPESPATINLGSTNFRGTSTSSAQKTDLEFAPDNLFAFLRADGANTSWDGVAVGSLSPSQRSAIDARILHYTDGGLTHPSVGATFFRGQFITGNTVVVPSTGGTSSADLALDVVPDGGTVTLPTGSFGSLSVPAGKDVTIVGNGATITSSSPALSVGAGSVVTASGLTIQDTSNDSSPAILVSGAGAVLNLSASTVEQVSPNTPISTPLVQVLSGGTADITTTALKLLNSSSAFVQEGPGSTANLGTGPTAATFTVTTNEDTSFDVDLSIDGQPLSSFGQPASGTGSVSFVSGNTVRYTPPANYNGTTSFTFSTSGGPTRTVNVVVLPVNDAPTIAVPLSLSPIAEDSSAQATAGVSIADIDTNAAGPFTVTITATGTPGAAPNTPGNGTLSATGAATITGTGTNALTITGSLSDVNATLATLSYTPTPNFFGTVSFNVTATDGTTPATPVSFTRSVTAINDAPVAVPPTVSNVPEDTATVTGTLGATDIDTAAASLVYSIVGGSAVGGTVSVTGSSFTFTPTPNYSGPASFQYTVSDGSLTSLPATVSFTITPVNDAPVLSGDNALTVVESQPGNISVVPLTTADLSATDADPSDTLVYQIVTDPSLGQIQIGNSTSGTPVISFTQAQLAAGSVYYRHFGGEPSSDSFTYRVSDGTTTTPVAPAVQTFNITVTPTNDAPVQVANTGLTVAEGATQLIGSSALAYSDADHTASQLVYTVTTNVNRGTLERFNGASWVALGSNGTFTQADVDSSRLRFVDSGVDPVANTSFNFSVTDGVIPSALTGVFNITVTAVNDAPTVTAPASVTTNEDTSFAFPATGTNSLAVSDADSTSVTATLSVTNGTLSIGGTGGTVGGNNSANVSITGTTLSELNARLDAVTFVPAANFSGTATLTITANDGTTSSAPAQVTINVTAVNDAPTVTAPTSVTTNEDTSFAFPATGTNSLAVSDADSTSVTATLSVTNGTLSIGGTGGTVSNNNTANVSITGTTLTQLNARLDAVTFVPAANFSGTATLTITANDGTTSSAPAQVTINVTAVNDAPTVTVTPLTINEGATSVISAARLAATDVDNADAQLTYTVTAVPSRGQLQRLVSGVWTAIAANGTFTQQNVANGELRFVDSGADPAANTSFTFNLRDPSNAGPTAQTFTINVLPVNDAPVANNLPSLTVNEDATLIGSLSATDADVPADTLVYSIVSQPTSGTVNITNVNTGAFTYTPAANFSGTASFTYKVNDGTVDSNTATVTISVVSQPDAPTVSAPASASTPEDATLAFTGPTLISVADVDSPASITVVVAVPQSDGTLTVAGSGGTVTPSLGGSTQTISGTIAQVNGRLATLSFVPTSNFNGSTSLTITAQDASTPSTVVNVPIAVTPVNDAPTVSSVSFNTNEDIAIVNQALSSSDVENDARELQLVSGSLTPNSGTLVFNSTSGTFTYTPASNFNGAVTFQYVAVETGVGGLTSTPATVTINIAPVDDAPTATPLTVTTAEDTPLTDVQLPGSDVDVGEVLTWSIVGPTPAGLVLNPTTGKFGYTPPTNFNGIVTFQYSVTDAADPIAIASTVETVTINVTAVNDAPTAVDDLYNIVEDAPSATLLPILTSNDLDVDTANSGLTVTAVDTTGTSGTVVINPDNKSFTYTPALNFNGTTTFTYRTFDGTTQSLNVATVTINVAAVDDAPVGGAVTTTTNEDVAIVDFQLPGSDVENETLTWSIVGPTPAGLTLNGATGKFNYLPPLNSNGVVTFNYKLTDQANPSAVDSPTYTVTINVTPVNDAPTAVADTAATNEETFTDVLVLGNDFDVDTGTNAGLTVTAVTQGTNGSVAIVSGLPRYTPNANFSGTDSFTYTISDAGGLTSTATVTITVNNVDNDPPVVVGESYSTNEDVVLNTGGPVPTLLANDSDPDVGTTLTVTHVGTTAIVGPTSVAIAGGTLLVSPNGTFSFTPTANFNGSTSFAYTVSDGTNSATATASITVVPVNDAPTITSPTVTAFTGLEGSTIILAGYSIGDVDAASGTLALTVTPAVGTVSVGGTGGTVSGAGTSTSPLVISGTIAEINARLATLTSTPTPDFYGSFNVAFSLSDNGNTGGAALTATASAAVTVTNVADAPVAVNDTLASIVEGGTATGNLLANDTDADNLSGAANAGLSIASVNGTPMPGSGTLTLNLPAGDLTVTSAGAVTFVYNSSGSHDSSGITFTYTVTDGALTSAPATASIAINNVIPVVGPISTLVVTQGFPVTTVTPTITFADPGAEGTWTYTVTGASVSPVSGSTTNRSFQPTLTFNAPGTYPVTVVVSDGEGTSIPVVFNVVVNAAPFQVDSFTATTSGFNVKFNRAFSPTGLNYYGASPDVIVTGPSGPVRGSLVWDAGSDTLSFVASGAWESDVAGRRGVLEPGTYSLTLTSAGFNDGFSNALTGGAGDSTPLTADYTRSFTVGALSSGTRVVSIDDFARGPGQAVNLPASSTTGIPVVISNRSNVGSIDFNFDFDPTQLTVTGVTSAFGWTSIDIVTTTLPNGRERWSVSAFGPETLLTGSGTIAFIQASVPLTATYGDSHLINLEVTDLADGNSDSIAVVADDAVHSVNFVGDANRNQNYSGGDATLIQTWVASFNAGLTMTNFTAYPVTDAVVVGDVNNSSTLTGADAGQVQLEVAAIQQNLGNPGSLLIPRLPGGTSGIMAPLGGTSGSTTGSGIGAEGTALRLSSPLGELPLNSNWARLAELTRASSQRDARSVSLFSETRILA